VGSGQEKEDPSGDQENNGKFYLRRKGERRRLSGETGGGG